MFASVISSKFITQLKMPAIKNLKLDQSRSIMSQNYKIKVSQKSLYMSDDSGSAIRTSLFS